MDKNAERRCLVFHLFPGDETPVRRLANKMLKTRAGHYCIICHEYIPIGSRVRAMTEINLEQRQVMTFYSCPKCCEAMAVSHEDNGRAICERTALGLSLPVPGNLA